MRPEYDFDYASAVRGKYHRRLLREGASIVVLDIADVTECTEVARSLPIEYYRSMSPTVFRNGSYRFYFFSREEPRVHIHVSHPDGEAKFWIEPEISLAQNHGLSSRQVATALRLIQEHKDEIHVAWKEHFGR